jgi:LmbE family N-acetylglucosaminyl deacetylase
MLEALRLLAVVAHPDDETLGMGGTLARYAAEGVDVHLVTATRGERGRFLPGQPRPSDEEVGRVREAELRAAAAALGVKEVEILGYPDGGLDRAEPRTVIGEIARHIRRIRPQVVITFDPFGAYGHPDHVAICQFTTAAIVAAAHIDSGVPDDPGGPPAFRVEKLFYLAWDGPTWSRYEHAFKKLIVTVDGAERRSTPWPDWSLTTRVDAESHWATVWKAVQCHRTQIAAYARLGELTPDEHRGLWGNQTFYRALSSVNGGRSPETDLFAALR